MNRRLAAALTALAAGSLPFVAAPASVASTDGEPARPCLDIVELAGQPTVTARDDGSVDVTLTQQLGAEACAGATYDLSYLDADGALVRAASVAGGTGSTTVTFSAHVPSDAVTTSICEVENPPKSGQYGPTGEGIYLPGEERYTTYTQHTVRLVGESVIGPKQFDRAPNTGEGKFADHPEKCPPAPSGWN